MSVFAEHLLSNIAGSGEFTLIGSVRSSRGSLQIARPLGHVGSIRSTAIDAMGTKGVVGLQTLTKAEVQHDPWQTC